MSAEPVDRTTPGAAERLPSWRRVHWRPRAERQLLTGRAGCAMAACTVAHDGPVHRRRVALLVAVKPLLIPISVLALVHAWAIPELYAARGAESWSGLERPPAGAAERRALGLLADLVDHRARELHARTGLVLERGGLGAWLIGRGGRATRPSGRPARPLLLRQGDRRRAAAGDRIAHLLLALREDEAGFATVANLAFSGAPWRLRRRLAARSRPGRNRAPGWPPRGRKAPRAQPALSNFVPRANVAFRHRERSSPS